MNLQGTSAASLNVLGQIQAGMSSKKRPNNLFLEELEPRILFSADPFAAADFSKVTGVANEQHLSLSDQDLSGLAPSNQALQADAGNDMVEQPIKQRVDQNVTTTLLASKDTYISDNNQGANYGTAGQIQIDISGGADLGKERIMLQFDLSSIPANATITNAELLMNATNHSGSSTVTVNVHEVTKVWHEGGASGGSGQANWDERTGDSDWDNSGGDYNNAAVASSNVTGTGLHSWNLTSTVQAWSSGSSQNRGVIIGSPQSGGDVFTYLSAEGSATNGPRLVVSYSLPNSPPTATAMNAAETYTEDQALDLSDIVISDPDDSTTTATLSLSNPGAGTLSTGTSGSVTSTYNTSSGVWQASGAINDVNNLLAAILFTPSNHFDSNFTIATEVSDGIAPSITGSKSLTAIPVNDAPAATGLNTAEVYTEDTPLNLQDITVTDVDNTTTTVQLVLSDVDAGSLTTATSGSVTSTFDSSSGTWEASGNINSVNALLLDLAFVPALNYNGDFSVATSVSDGSAPLLNGSKSFLGTAANDAPTASNLNAGETYTEDTQLNLVDITIADVDDGTTSAMLTLSDATAGSLSTGSSGAVTSTYDPATGEWSAAGAIADVNALLADVTFMPEPDYDQSLFITTQITDGNSPAVIGSKLLNAIAVNDAPVVAALGGDVLIAQNDGTAYSLDTNAISVLSDVDLPSDYAGAFLDVSGLGFTGNDALSINGSGSGISLSAGISNGSVVTVSGVDVGSLSVASASSFRINLNSASTAVHVEALLRNLTFGTDSATLGARSVNVVFNDGDGSANGGSETSATQTVTVYVAQAGVQQVTALEDTAYTFTASDFDFTGITGSDLGSITILSLPQDSGSNRGSLMINGMAATVGQVISKTDIDNGELEFWSDLNDNGTPYASFDFQVGNGKLNIPVLSGQPTSDTLLGSGWPETNALLPDTNNFGLGGAYPSSFSLVSNSTTIDAAYLSQGRIFVDGGVNDSAWSTAELNALTTWVNNGGVLIASADGSSTDDVANHFGLLLGGQTAPTWQVSDSLHPIMNGHFGSVGNNGDPIANNGSRFAYFNPASLDPDDKVIATGSAGSSQPTMVLRQVGGGWVLFTGDEGIFRGNMSGGGVISTPNDILVANIFAWAAEQLPPTDSHTMSVGVAPVNDAPSASNLGTAQNYLEDTPLDLSDIVVTDIDDSNTSVKLSLSDPGAGTLTTATSATVSSTFDPGTGVWSASGDIASVNTLLAGVNFIPAADYDSDVNIVATISDGVAPAILGTKLLSGQSVNDAPVISGINGSATIISNNGVAAVLGAGALATLQDSDAPPDYGGAVLQVTGTGFMANDALGLDTSGTVSLSSGLDAGSVVSISGTPVGNINASGPGALGIVFNNNSTAAHVERLLNSITFASTSSDFSTRSVDIEFNDGGGTSNGGKDTSPTATALIYLKSADIGLVVGNEDTAYAFQVSDFDFTGVPGNSLQFIRVVTTPTSGTLSLSGIPVNDGQRIERADIDAGNLVYVPEPNANGLSLASLSVQINNGILSTNILAGHPNAYTLGESSFANADAILASADNFGAGGVSPTSISLVASSSVIDANYLEQGDIFFNGDPLDSVWSNDELVALDNWVSNGGVLISTNDSSSSNRVSEYFGLSIGGSSSATWRVADAGADIINGLFGSVGSNGSPFSATGFEHSYFSSASLNPGDSVLAVDTNTGEPTLVLRQYGAGAILFSGDEGIFRANTTGGGTVTTPNDILVANIFAWAIDQIPDAEEHALNIAVNAVNDAPVVSGLNASELYQEDTALNLSNIVISDVDSASITVRLALSTPEAGVLTTATYGAVSSAYDETSGVWSASGDLGSLNTLLANVEFIPAPNFNADFDISTQVIDGVSTTLNGLKTVYGTSVNDLPVGVVTVNNLAPIEDDLLIAANTLTDADGLGEVVRYQWLRDGQPIDGAIGSRYTVTAGDIGSQLAVVASYTDNEGTLESVVSEATEVVARKNLPASVNLSQSSISLAEYPVSTERIRLADIDVTDDGIGENEVTLSGPDAALFEIEDGVLYLRADAMLDFETATRLEVSVDVDDPEVAGSPDDSEVFEILVQDFDEAALVAGQTIAVSSAADSVSSSTDTESELSAESVELDALSIASTISNDLERGLLPGATREFDAEGTADQADLDVVISGVEESAQNFLPGVEQGVNQKSIQTVDLELLLNLDTPEVFVDPLSALGELASVDPMEGFSLLDNSSFQSGLDDMRRQVLDVDLQNKIVVGSTVSVTTGVSIGYVLWLIRGSVLLSTVLSSLPAWRLIDPLPVISGMLNEEDDDGESLESIIEDSEAERGVNADAIDDPKE